MKNFKTLSGMRNLFLGLTLVVGLMFSQTTFAQFTYDQGFETDTYGWYSGGDYGTLERVSSGTDGITSANGSWHCIMEGTASAPYTYFNGSKTDFRDGFTASIDIYIDVNMDESTGFDYTVAVKKQDGSGLRDFIWHVGQVDGYGLLVNASNNTDFVFNASKLLNNNGGNYYTITESGWYTFKNVYYNNAGALACDLELYDDGGNLLLTNTRTNSADLIATVVGGNWYGWFCYISVAGGVPTDDVTMFYNNEVCNNMMVDLVDSHGWAIDGSLEYREGGGNPWEDATEVGIGQFCINTERSQIGLRMTYGPQIQKLGGVITAENYTFQTINTTVELMDGGNPVNGGVVTYSSDGWFDFGITGDDGDGICQMEMLPVPYSFRMTYDGYTKSKKELVSSVNNYFTFEVADLKSALVDGENAIQMAAYPNPFSGNATIAFELENTQDVTVAVYDVTGKLVEVLQEGMMEAGAQKLIWEGNDVQKGVYFVRFSSEGKVYNKSIVKM